MDRFALWQGDCLEVMKNIEDQSVDMILCDLPYGTTACEWDRVIPFEPLWEQYNRVIKRHGAIVLFGSQPFTSLLVASNLAMFKYEWVWEKNRSTGHIHSKNKPMKKHENIVVFSKGVTVHKSQSDNRMNYYPQGLQEMPPNTLRRTLNDRGDDTFMGARKSHRSTVYEHTNYPNSILNFDIEMNDQRFHPTQKPIALLEYLIKTYTSENDLVLDNCMGGGSTGVACLNIDRRFAGIELNEEYFEVAKNRITENSILTGKEPIELDKFLSIIKD